MVADHQSGEHQGGINRFVAGIVWERCGEISAGKFHRIAPKQYRQRSGLFRLDVRRFDDRPPFVDLSLLEGSQSLRRLLLARHNLVTQVHEPLAGRWIRQRLDNRRVELADDVLRRALWSPNRTPDRSVEPG